jgi:phosphate transport system protein
MASAQPLVGQSETGLGELRVRVAEMGGLAEAALEGAMQALLRRDQDSAAAIVVGDARIDAIEAEIERDVARLIVDRSLQGDDLREVLAALKIAGAIERIGDYGKNIAKRVPLLNEVREIEPISILPEMARVTIEMVRAALDAYAARNADAAILICDSDRRVDDFYNSLFRALLAYMADHPHTITPSTHLLFVAKNLERIGDHATNIAEMVYFAATGIRMSGRGRGVDALSQT